MVFFDHAATTPLFPEVAEKIHEISISSFANPASLHSPGLQAKRVLEDARQTLAQRLQCEPQELIFTSGGTESNNLALRGLAEKKGFKGHIITSAIEHHSVLETCEQLEKEGISLTILPVDDEGIISLKELKESIRPDTFLISIMAANNEIGSLQPISEIAGIAREAGVVFHTDMVQGAGYLSVEVDQVGADLMSFSSHKFYGPKGIGLLYIRKGTQLAQQMHGGAQEFSLRAGTVNVAGAMGMALAFDMVSQSREEESGRVTEIRDTLIQKISSEIPGAVLSGHAQKRLANNVHFCFEGIDGGALMMRLNHEGFATSTGSACTAGLVEISHVMRALRRPDALARGALRISLGKENTTEQAELLFQALERQIMEMRS